MYVPLPLSSDTAVKLYVWVLKGLTEMFRGEVRILSMVCGVVICVRYGPGALPVKATLKLLLLPEQTGTPR